METLGVRVLLLRERMKEVEVRADVKNNILPEVEVMKTFPLAKENEGSIAFAFEIENAYVSRRTIARLLGQVEGITDVHLRGHFGSSDEIRIEFKYLGHDYVVWEPFGDNSRYWIGPKNPEQSGPDIVGLQEIFNQYQPPFYRALFGDLLTFRLFRRFVGHQ